MNEAIREKIESAEEGSIISDVAAIKDLCDQSNAPAKPSTEEVVQAKHNALKPLRDAELIFADFDKLYNEVAKPILDGRREMLNKIAALVPVGHTFQDAEGIVYQLDNKKGTFVDFTPFEIKRTQRVFAEGGSHILARKAAEELGYQPFKPEKPAKKE